MKVLHTESSPGWGGQEIRILREAVGMKERGHELFFIVEEGSPLAKAAQEKGFIVYETKWKKSRIFSLFFLLLKVVLRHRIEILNTHSSLDAWLGGIAARCTFRKVVRTRHLSTSIKNGLNSLLLYGTFADYVVTTCSAIVPTICKQAKIPLSRCSSVPTGIDSTELQIQKEAREAFRKKWGIEKDEVVAGTVCVMRGWKGISDLLQTASLLKEVPKLRWLIVGGGVSESHFHREHEALALGEKVIFTGHLQPPFEAIAAIDIFLLLSWAHEGVSQASLQAAWLKKPLVTTAIGGLSEVCIENQTGYLVSPHNPQEVAKAIKTLFENELERRSFGENAHRLVEEKFLFSKTLDEMERIYLRVKSRKN